MEETPRYTHVSVHFDPEMDQYNFFIGKGMDLHNTVRDEKFFGKKIGVFEIPENLLRGIPQKHEHESYLENYPLGEIRYYIHKSNPTTARTGFYAPKREFGEKNAKGIPYFLEWLAAKHLAETRGITHYETTDPSQARKDQFERVGLDWREKHEINTFLKAWERGMRGELIPLKRNQ